MASMNFTGYGGGAGLDDLSESEGMYGPQAPGVNSNYIPGYSNAFSGNSPASIYNGSSGNYFAGAYGGGDGGMWGGTGVASGNYGGPGNVNTLSRVKNPALNTMQAGAQTQTGALNTTNQGALNAYGQAVGTTTGNAGQFYNAALQPLSNLYGGQELGNLQGIIGSYGQGASNLIGGLQSNLAGANAGYNTTASGLIGQESGQLGQNTTAYQTQAQNTLNNLVTGLAQSRQAYGNAAQQATNLSIGQQLAANNARNIAAGGYGGSSYYNAQGANIRATQQASLQAQLAQLAQQNMLTTEGQQQGITQTASEMGRANIGLTAEQQQALAANMNQMQRGDIGYVYGQGSGLLGNVEGQNIGANQYVLGQQFGLGNQANTLGQQFAGNYLLPAQAGTALNSQYLGQLGQLGQLDTSNRFYGVTDNQSGGYGAGATSGATGAGGYGFGANAPGAYGGSNANLALLQLQAQGGSPGGYGYGGGGGSNGLYLNNSATNIFGNSPEDAGYGQLPPDQMEPYGVPTTMGTLNF